MQKNTIWTHWFVIYVHWAQKLSIRTERQLRSTSREHLTTPTICDIIDVHYILKDFFLSIFFIYKSKDFIKQGKINYYWSTTAKNSLQSKTWLPVNLPKYFSVVSLSCEHTNKAWRKNFNLTLKRSGRDRLPISPKFHFYFKKGSSKNSYERRYYESVDDKSLS